MQGLRDKSVFTQGTDGQKSTMSNLQMQKIIDRKVN